MTLPSARNAPLVGWRPVKKTEKSLCAPAEFLGRFLISFRLFGASLCVSFPYKKVRRKSILRDYLFSSLSLCDVKEMKRDEKRSSLSLFMFYAPA
jgi:hypothetical protein